MSVVSLVSLGSTPTEVPRRADHFDDYPVQKWDVELVVNISGKTFRFGDSGLSDKNVCKLFMNNVNWFLLGLLTSGHRDVADFVKKYLLVFCNVTTEYDPVGLAEYFSDHFCVDFLTTSHLITTETCQLSIEPHSA